MQLQLTSPFLQVDEHMDDYEDYVRFLVQRWSVTSLKHFVVWNEVASAGWMDMSPFIPNRWA